MDPLLIFDGDCGFCTSAARWGQRAFRRGERAVPYQQLDGEMLSSLGLTPADARAAAWWVASDGRRSRGHRAIGRALLAGRSWRAVVGWLCLAPPTSWVAALAYRGMVRLRPRLPGTVARCSQSGERGLPPGADAQRPW